MKKILKRIRTLYIMKFKPNIEYLRHIGIKVGENCRIYTRNFGKEPWLVSIGSNVTITANCSFITHDGSTWLMRDEKGRRYLYRRIKVGNNVFIGSNSIVLPGIEIEDNVIIAAGSIVTKSVPSGKIIGGNPAKVIGSFKDYKDRVLTNYVSDQDMDFEKTYMDRINAVLDKTFKEKLS
jgi:acetyltransferase-like isoleucine patch superfamily enzyme